MKLALSRRQLLRCPLGLAAIGLAPAFSAESDPPQGILRRLLGPRAADFQFDLAPESGARSWYRALCANGKILIRGSDAGALARGAYAFLKAQGAASVSWEGVRAAPPPRWEDHDSGVVETPFRHRAFLNPCTFGYSTPWWGWRRWERELDWMALHGIDLPLALEGQEFIWRILWREVGLGESDIAAHFSAAPFAPWQRMGNIEGYDAPLPSSWIEGKRGLQEKILTRMREFGMTPVLPGFAGYVPQALAALHPEARIYRMRPWEGFAPTSWLDPGDPLFAQLSARFLTLYRQCYGGGTHFLVDAFNETLPPVSEDGAELRDATYGDATANSAAAQEKAVPPERRDARLAAYGEAIYRSLADTVPDAVWTLQSWMFGADRDFWTADAVSAFLSKVPDRRMLVLDLGNDRYPDVWTQAQAFKGKNWIYGYVHNYGGSNPLYGDLPFYRSDLKSLLQRSDTGNLAGFGVFPEGLHNNSMVYEHLFDLAWGGLDQPLDAWLDSYARNRYGFVSPRLTGALSKVLEACYRTRYWTPRWWRGQAGAYLLCKRPARALAEFEGHPGDRPLLREATRELAELAGQYRTSTLFQYDLAELVRHLASLDIDSLLQRILIAFQNADLAAIPPLRKRLAELVAATNHLLGAQQDCLASWIEEAESNGADEAEKILFARQAKTLVTLWGGKGDLHDYASRAWQGLYLHFYLPRWDSFFDALHRAAEKGGDFDEPGALAAIARWEEAWVRNRRRYVRQRPSLPSAAQGLLGRLAE